MNSIDPITLEVMRGYFVSTVFQMRATLLRTAYAPILYDTMDFSCGLLTPTGELMAMSEDISGHVFAMSLGQKASLDKFGDDIHPGDVMAVNDPYTGGTHLNDIAFYTPFFADGKILLYIAVRAHHADVGGATPGSFSGQDTEIYQEGVRIVPVKLINEGKVNQALWDVVFANMRLSEEREGDALAMLDTARVAEMQIAGLCEKYGIETVKGSMEALLDGAEETMRRSISGLPDGEYYYEHYMDSGGLTPEPVPLKVKLTIKGEGMTFDFTGTSPQVVGPMNCGIPITMGGVFVIIKSWLDPKTPINGGTFRSLDFIIPKGSCLAAELPTPVGGCWEVYRQLQSVVVGLLSQVIPDDLGAENMGTVNHIYVAGFDDTRGKPYILYEYPMGGVPATSDTDGATGIAGYENGDIPGVYPAESVEQRQPLLVESMEVRSGGEGAGYHRSGFGVTRRVRVLSDSAQLNVMADRSIIPPWGVAGAPSSSLNSVTVVRDGVEVRPSPIPGKVKAFPLKYGDIVLMQAASGAGVGDPLEREVELVRKEVFDEYVSPERARDVYGVVFDNGAVDRAATDKHREDLKKQRRYFDVVASDDDEFDERGCRVCRLSPRAADRLGVRDGDMIEYVPDKCAPLRAWASVGDGLAEQAVAIGPVGRRTLLLSAGDRIWVRAVATAPVGPLAS